MSIAPRSAFFFDRRPTGSWIVGGMIGLGVALAVFAIAFQRGQTRRCLSFYGSEAAHRVQTAPRVELWRLGPGMPQLPPPADRRTDISQARGLVHLRRGLVEDANFAWDAPAPAGPAPVFALAFFDQPAAAEPDTVVLIRLDASGGALEVAGRPGAVTLGRLAGGLRKWLADAAAGPGAGG